MSTPDNVATPPPERPQSGAQGHAALNQPPIWPELHKPTVAVGQVDPAGVGHITEAKKPNNRRVGYVVVGLIALAIGGGIGAGIAHAATATPVVLTQSGAPAACLAALTDAETHASLNNDAWYLDVHINNARQTGDSGMASVLTDQFTAKADSMKPVWEAFMTDAAACRAAG